MPTALNISPAYFAQIDRNAQQLGKFERRGLKYHKSYLSINDKGQWQLLKLGLLDVIQRNYFGYYKDTHLKHIYRAWSQYRLQDDLYPKITVRLNHLWSKTYPKKTPPPFAHFIGNSLLQEARVIAIGLLHTDPTSAYMTGKILSEYYKEGDAIIVEGVDADVSLNAKEVPMTALMSKPAIVQGWEPVGYTEMQSKIFAPALALDSAFRASIAQIEDLFKHVKSSGQTSLDSDAKTQEILWFKLLDKAILCLTGVIKKIEEGEQENLSNSSKELIISYNQFLSSLQQPNDISLFLKIFKNISCNCQKFLEKKKYNSLWTPEATLFFKESWPIREESLCHEIQSNLDLGKRVFICAGSARFFPNKGKSESQVVNLLKNHKFTIGLANNTENDSYYSFKKLFKQFAVHDKIGYQATIR